APAVVRPPRARGSARARHRWESRIQGSDPALPRPPRSPSIRGDGARSGRIEQDPLQGASMNQPDTARLLIACDDQPGIVAAVAGVLAEHGANIISLDQHSTDSEGGRFFQRTVIHLDGLAAARPALEASIQDVAERFGMEWSLHD